VPPNHEPLTWLCDTSHEFQSSLLAEISLGLGVGRPSELTFFFPNGDATPVDGRLPKTVSRSGGRKSFFETALLVCLIVTLSYLSAKVGQALSIHQGMVFPVWPANAILVSILLLVRLEKWPVLILAAFTTFVVFDLQAATPPRLIVLFLASDAAEVLIAAFGLRYLFGGPPKLEDGKALAKYSICAVLIAPAAGTFIGAFANAGSYWTAWSVSFLSEALEFLILTPAILGWIQEGWAWGRKPRSYYVEGAALLAALTCLGYLTFDTFRKGLSPVLLYSLVPLLLWSALRFGTTGVSTSMIVIGYLSIWGVVHEIGPFTRNMAGANLVSLELFLFFAAGLFMVLSVLASERRREEQERKKSQEKFSKAFQDSPMGITLTSARDQRYIEVNETFERVTGFRREDVIGRTPFDVGIWLDPSERAGIVNQLLKVGSLRNIEHEFRTMSGEIRNGLSSAELIEIDGEPCVLSVTDDITERKRADEHFRLAVESAPNGMVIVDQTGKIDRLNAQAESLFGYQRDELVGKPIDLLVPEPLRTSHAGFRKDYIAHAAARPMGAGRDLKARRKDGSEFPVEIGLNPMQTSQGTKILCSIVDITERKKAESALRESEQRFRLVANSAPVMIWMSGTDKLCTFFNQGWLDFTGRALPDELGNGWASGVHPEDLNRCLKTYSEAFDARVDFQMEYRLRRFDGQYRWITDVGVTRYTADGSFQGYIGSAIDITDRKLSEAALLDMSGRLIVAQEEERARIARELHDDLSQRMALLEIGLEEFEQETAGLTPFARKRLHDIAEIATGVSTDIHDISHELHPSKLDSLGLVAAVGGFCREFSKQHGIALRFIHHRADGKIPKGVTLCIFRIVQEALQNVAKHSGAEDATVELSGHADRLDLCVSDSGIGFNPESEKESTGIGLISIRERLRLVGGQLIVESEPMHGTRIMARVPLVAADEEFRSHERARETSV
jgi:PAS domain S-box-containing protein